MATEPKDIRPALYAEIEARYCQDRRVQRPRSTLAEWHVVQIISGRERTIAERLEEHHSFGTYSPMLRVMKPVPRKKLSARQRASGAIIKRPVIEPFLPGYLFVEFDPVADPWHEIFALMGVRGMWCNGNRPMPFKRATIEEWKASEVGGAIPGDLTADQLFGGHFPFEVGEQIRIVSGPFASFSGTIARLPSEYDGGRPIEELDESKRVGVFAHLFGRPTPIELTLSQIEKL